MANLLIQLQKKWKEQMKSDDKGEEPLVKPPREAPRGSRIIPRRSKGNKSKMQLKLPFPIPPKSCNARSPIVKSRSPIDRSHIKFRKSDMERRGRTMGRKGPDGCDEGNASLFSSSSGSSSRSGLNHLSLLAGGRVRVHDWVYVCLSSEMVTRQEFKFFTKDLIYACEAIGMNIRPLPRCSLWPATLENVLVALQMFWKWWKDGNHRMVDSMDDAFKDILLLCKDHGITFLDLPVSHIKFRNEKSIYFTAWKLKDQVEYLERTGAAELCKEIDENGHHVESGKDIGGDGSSEEFLGVHASGSPNVPDDDRQEGSDKEQGGDGGPEHEKSTHRDGFPGSVEEAESEDVLPKDSDGGFHGSVDLMESIDHSALQVFEKGNVESWAYISFSMSEDETLDFLEKLLNACTDMGMGFYQVPTSSVHVKPSSPEDVEDALWSMHDEISEIFSAYGEEIGLLLVILPDKKVGDEIYGESEKVCERLGFVYHCCSPKDARKPSMTYLENTAYEINKKVLRRDAAHNFVMPFSAIEDDPTIVFGADIFRDSDLSVASVVSTIDWPVSSWYKCVVAEQPCEEVIIKKLHHEDDVRKSLVRCCLLYFSRITKIRPCRILFFRNGVDEGQLSFIFSQEIDAIRKACTSVFTAELPITYVVVGRAESAVGEDNSTKFEFSCCHPVAGETRTVTYRVLHNENGYDADELQSICTKLCTNRVRWDQPEVSMVPPAYYAHLAASGSHALLQRQGHFKALTTSAQRTASSWQNPLKEAMTVN